MRVRWLIGALSLFAAFGLGLTACGSSKKSTSSSSGSTSGGSVTIYSSLPLQGTSKGQSEAVVNGEKLALKQAGNKIGNLKVTYNSLDDSTAQTGSWDPGQVSSNARKAAQDKSTIFYLGEFNSGASAISIPILNEAGVPQISPSNTAVGLTSNGPGADKGEPDKYYPTGKRTYARIVPNDQIQGAALATVMKQDGCKQVAILNDKEVYGSGLAKNIERSGKAQGLTITGNQGIDKKAPNYRSLASSLKADCVVYSGITANNAVQLFKDVGAALPSAKLYGPDGVAEAAFTDPKKGGIPAALAGRTKVSVATLPVDKYPAEGQKFFSDYKTEYGGGAPDPYAIYGYEAMNLALDAIKRAGAKGNDRTAVLQQLFNTKDRSSVLGTYSIDTNGDTTLTDYGIYKIAGGQMKYDSTVKATKG